MGLIAGVAATFVWMREQERAALDAYQLRVDSLATVSDSVQQDATAARVHADSVLTANTALRGAIRDLTRQVAVADGQRAQTDSALRDARTAADSVPLLVHALSLADAGRATMERVALLQRTRADSAETALGRTNKALGEAQADAAHWKALAGEKPAPETRGRIPLLGVPWPKLFLGVGGATNGRDGTLGIVAGVGYSL